MCRSHMSHLKYVQLLTALLSACLPTVKPTVINVGIYVNSIGPVSSIDMVSSGFCTHVLPSLDVSITRRDHSYSLEGLGGVAILVLKRGDAGRQAFLGLHDHLGFNQ